MEENLTDKKNILELVTVANDYCLFLEKAGEYPKDEIVAYLTKVFPLLYLKAALLPLVQPDDDQYNERFVIEQEWMDLFNVLHNLLGDEDAFYCYRPAETIENEIFKASLSENLADIYQDLKDFVILYLKNSVRSKEAAVYSCYWLFRSHWGPLLIESLPHLHSLAFNKRSAAEEGTVF